MNGTQNLWIIKPGGLSRGRNIKIFDNYPAICQYVNIPYQTNPNGMQVFDIDSKMKSEQPAWTQKSWVAQKYIENPLLVHNRKFDIRVWILVASWNPLKLYYYRDCYVRFSS
jgi:tubulin monoglycylase TTLL3/8